MQRQSEIDKFLAALCHWLAAVNDGIPADMHRIAMDMAHPHLSVVTVSSNIVTLRQLLRDYESRVHEAKSQSSLVADFCRLNQLLQCEYVEQNSKLTAAAAEKKSLTLKINRLEEKLSKTEAENDRLIRQKYPARLGPPPDSSPWYALDHGPKSHLSQVLDRPKAAKRDSKSSLQDNSNWKKKYGELLHKYKKSEANLKQLATGRQRRDSGLEDQATSSHDRAASVSSDPLVLHTDLERSISRLREQKDDQRQRLTQLKAKNEGLQAELDDLEQDKAVLEAQNVMASTKLSIAQRTQTLLQKQVRTLQHECDALWEHLIYIEAERDDVGGESVQNRGEKAGGWVQQAAAVVLGVLQEVNERQKMYYVLH
ncbi:unnamed protein product [Cercospora beticola]|nr:unnamed protein product [Cercospora beticola]